MCGMHMAFAFQSLKVFKLLKMNDILYNNENIK